MTTTDTPKIFPLGNGALTVEFGHDVSVDLNKRAIALATYMDANRFDGYIEAAPAYASTTIFFDVPRVRRVFADFPTAHEAVMSLVERALSNLSEDRETTSRVIEIEVNFEPDEAPDLSFVAERSGLTEHDVIEIFTSTEYRVYMVGFLPGFAYMGEVDARIATPRRETPRVKVPKGSVGIGGRQTGIYPFESPGGWQIIGRTDVDLFDPENEPPCPLRPGDTVRFVNARR